MRSNQIISAVAVLAISLALPAIARAGGDAAAGKIKGPICLSCHTAITGDTPHLVGQREGYIAKQLKAFKSGDRKNPVMNAMAGALSDADVENLAAFLSSQPAGSDATASEEVTAMRKSKMAFPKDFPKGFTEYGARNKEGQNAVARAYVNDVGMKAAKAGQPLPDGTIFMVINYAAKLDANKKPAPDKDGIWATEKIAGYEGMEMRAGWGAAVPELVRNLNWNYAVFGPDKAQKADLNQMICQVCHVPAASKGYVFSLEKLQAKAHAK
jgi:cytochrome c553